MRQWEVMKKKSLILLFSIACFALFASVPAWVLQYQETGTIENQEQYYFGVGVSEDSSQDADQKAFTAFGMSIETIVKSETSTYLAEKNGKLTDEITKEIKISTDVGLNGISITGRYQDDKSFYSIIQYKKEAYNAMLKEEINRSIERQKIALEKEIASNKMKEKQKKEQLRSFKEKKRLEEKFAIEKGKYRDKLKADFPEFFSELPAYNLVSFRNAELIPNKKQVNLKAGIAPISIEEVFLAYKVWLLEFSMQASFYDNKYAQQEVQIKYQVLPNTGDFYKLSAAIGFVGYQTDLIHSSFENSEHRILSPFVCANVSVPNLYFSHISGYVDRAKVSVAIQNYPFFRQLKQRLSILLESNFYFEDHLRTSFNESFVVQPAIQFRTTETITTSISFEQNETWKLGLEFSFK
jgi:hypothetical protein